MFSRQVETTCFWAGRNCMSSGGGRNYMFLSWSRNCMCFKVGRNCMFSRGLQLHVFKVGRNCMFFRRVTTACLQEEVSTKCF